MRIDDWPLNQIMQLPDWCFGQQFVVSCDVTVFGAVSAWDISEMRLPDHCVIWQLSIAWLVYGGDTCYLRMGLGHHLPATVAQMSANDNLIADLGRYVAGQRQFFGSQTRYQEVYPMRRICDSQGRNLIVEATGAAGIGLSARVGLVVSGVPTEVPDWLVSGKVNVQ